MARSRVVAVTGGSGIGLSAAMRFGRSAPVVVAEVSHDRLEYALKALKDAGVDGKGLVCDISSQDDVARFAELVAATGSLSVLCHAAGLSPSMASAQRIMEVNYLGTQLVLSALASQLGAGAVAFCFSSLSGDRRGVHAYTHLMDDPRDPDVMCQLVDAARNVPAAAYALSKLGVRLIATRFADAVAKQGARVISISPGAIDTEMGRLEVSRRSPDKIDDGVPSFIPLARWASADEVAGFLELLCDPAASYVTGCDIRIDGGAMARLHVTGPADVAARFDDPWLA